MLPLATTARGKDDGAATEATGEVADQGTTKIRVPAYGKTGTTNDYTNAYFAGFLPYPTEQNGPMTLANATTLASYVGYDMNKTMRQGFLRISGAHGALPAWIGMGKSLIKSIDYQSHLDSLDLSVLSRKEWSVRPFPGSSPLRIDMPRGVVLSRTNQDDEAYATTDLAVTGESRFDEFRANVVEATIDMPVDADGRPLRYFEPFALPGEDGERPEGRGSPAGSGDMERGAGLGRFELKKRDLDEPQMDQTESDGSASGRVDRNGTDRRTVSGSGQPDEQQTRSPSRWIPPVPKGDVNEPSSQRPLAVDQGGAVMAPIDQVTSGSNADGDDLFRGFEDQGDNPDGSSSGSNNSGGDAGGFEEEELW